MATLNKFGVPVNETKEGMLMPKRKHLFRVTFTGFGPLQGTSSIDLTRQIQTFDKPKIAYPEIEIHAYNSRAYYAGKHEWTAVTMVVRDDITNSVSTLVGHQIQKQLNHFEQVSPIAGSNYKFETIIETMDGGNVGVLERWILEGCFLSNIEYDALDYTSADPQTISMTIRYDNATLDGGLFTLAPELRFGRLNVGGVDQSNTTPNII